MIQIYLEAVVLTCLVALEALMVQMVVMTVQEALMGNLMYPIIDNLTLTKITMVETLMPT
jgi:hypothetical protein